MLQIRKKTHLNLRWLLLKVHLNLHNFRQCCAVVFTEQDIKSSSFSSLLPMLHALVQTHFSWATDAITFLQVIIVTVCSQVLPCLVTLLSLSANTWIPSPLRHLLSNTVMLPLCLFLVSLVLPLSCFKSSLKLV